MFTITKSYGNCSKCRLIDAPSCILETNIKDGDLTKCDVLFSAENPGQDEIEAERPLVGRAGKIFRGPFDELIKDDFNYVISNSTLCLTLNSDGTTGNATYKDVDNV